MEIKRSDGCKVKVVSDDGGFIQDESVIANLLYEILKTLEHIDLQLSG